MPRKLLLLYVLLYAQLMVAQKKAVTNPTVSLSAFLESGLTFDPADPATPLPAEFLVKGLAKGYTPKQMEAAIRQDGQVIVRTVMEKAGAHDGLTNLTSSAVGNYGVSFNPLATGSYTCDLYVDRKKIFTFPFKVTVVKNDLPGAQAKEFRLIDGYWSRYGYLAFSKDGKLSWNMYLTSLNPSPVADLKEQKDYKTEVQLFYNDKPVTDVAKQLVWCQRGKWMPVSFQFKNKGLTVGKKQLTADGRYVLKVKVNKEEREYTFDVKDSKIVLLPEQDKTKTRDTAKLFEGLGTEFWVKRTK